MREAARDATARPDLGDKVHTATLHTILAWERLVAEQAGLAELRAAAREARLRALERHDALVDRFRAELAGRGITLHFAETPAQACELLTRLVSEVGRRVTKSKSMTSEEVGAERGARGCRR